MPHFQRTTFIFLQLDMIILNESGDKSNYQPNGEFELEGYRPRRNVVKYACCPNPYIDITYSITMRRRPMFYVFNLILPCILINGIGSYSEAGCTSLAGGNRRAFLQ